MAKKRNVLTEPAKKSAKATDAKGSDNKKTPEASENATEEKPKASKPAGKSRKTQSIEDKRQKDRDYQKNKYDKQKEQDTEQAERESKELLLAVEAFACMPFDFMARRDPVWILTTQEREAFTHSTKALLDKYASFVSGYSIECSFALSLLAIVVPRYFANAEKKQVGGNTGKEGNGEDTSGEKDDGVPP